MTYKWTTLNGFVLKNGKKTISSEISQHSHLNIASAFALLVSTMLMLNEQLSLKANWSPDVWII